MLAELLLAAASILTPDLNGDGVVDALDVNILAAHWQTGDVEGDVNGDGFVDAFDLNVLAGLWQMAAQQDWSAPQEQTYTGVFHPGVLAWHPNGVDHVEFYVNDFTTFKVYPIDANTNYLDMGEWFKGKVSNINPDTGKPDLWITLDALNSPNGRFVLRAAVIPTFGDAQPLPDFYFFLQHWPTPQMLAPLSERPLEGSQKHQERKNDPRPHKAPKR